MLAQESQPYFKSPEEKQKFFQTSGHHLIRPFGGGSYGKVWLARSAMGAYRAIKIVFRSDFRSDTPYDREFRGIEKFEPISRDHDGFVDILHVGRNDAEGYFFYVMELGDDEKTGQQINPDTYQGRTLTNFHGRAGRLPFEECLRLSLKLSLALGEMHKAGLVHRDIKPSNIIFVNGTPKLADIGLVTDAGADVSWVGTEGYIPPEGPGAPAADLFSLGKVLYEISTGNDRKDFPIPPVEMLEGPEASRFLEFNEVLVHACEPEVALRYQTAEEMHAHLALLQAGQSVRRLLQLERWWRWGRRALPAVLLLAILFVVVFFVILRENRRQDEDRQRRVANFVNYGTRAIENGDWYGSLPWLTEALRLEAGQPFREDIHRLRLGSVLEQCPKPVRIWFFPHAAHHLNYAEFGPDSHHVLTANREGLSAIYDLRTGLAATQFTKFFGTGEYREKASFSPDFRRAVLSDFAEAAVVYDFAAGSNTLRLSIDANDYISLAKFNPAGDRIVTASYNQRLATVWDAQSGRPLFSLPQHKKAVWHAAFSPDGRSIITGCFDGGVALWDAFDGHLVRTFPGHQDLVNGTAFHPDGRRLASASGDRTARVWETDTGRELLRLEHADGVASIEFSPNGKYLLTACWDATVRLWDAQTGRPAGPPLKHSGRMMHACFSPDGRRILTVSYDGFVTVWDMPMERLASDETTIAFSSSGNISAALTNQMIVVHAGLTNAPLAQFPITNQLAAPPHFNPDGRVILTLSKISEASGEPGLLAEVRRTENGRRFGPSFRVEAGLTNASFSHDGARLLTYGRSNAVCWDTSSGKPLASFAYKASSTPQLTLDPSGQRLAMASTNHVRLFDPATGRPLLETPLDHPPGRQISHVEFSPDARLLVTTYFDGLFERGAAQLWDTATGLAVGQPLKHRDGVLHATFSPDGRRLVTSGEDFCAIVWDTASIAPLSIPPLQHKGQVTSARFSKDGRWIVTASRDHTARVWETETGEPITLPFAHGSALLRARFVENDTCLLAEGKEGKRWLWKLPRARESIEELTLIAQLLSAQPASRSRVGFVQSDELLWSSYEQLLARRPELFQPR